MRYIVLFVWLGPKGPASLRGLACPKDAGGAAV
jgi:hypothetical protein